MENQEVKHYQVNGKYRIVIERAASTKGVDGFKIESNGDDLDQVAKDADALVQRAIQVIAVNIPVLTTSVK
jgi:hypothetical protein